MSDCLFCNPEVRDEQVHFYVKIIYKNKTYAGHAEVPVDKKDFEETFLYHGHFLVGAALRTLRNNGHIPFNEPE